MNEKQQDQEERETQELDGASYVRREGAEEEREPLQKGASGNDTPDEDENSAADQEGSVEEAAADGEGQRDPQEDMEQLRDQFLRLNADFDNYRKRMQRDREDWSRYASQSFMEKLLPVVDNLDAAVSAMANVSQEVKTVAEGFLMIHKQLVEALNQEGLAEIPALGALFDPNIHEAVMTVRPGENEADGQVVMVIRKGYMFKDKVLRPAMVQVAKEN